MARAGVKGRDVSAVQVADQQPVAEHSEVVGSKSQAPGPIKELAEALPAIPLVTLSVIPYATFLGMAQKGTGGPLKIVPPIILHVLCRSLVSTFGRGFGCSTRTDYLVPATALRSASPGEFPIPQ